MEKRKSVQTIEIIKYLWQTQNRAAKVYVIVTQKSIGHRALSTFTQKQELALDCPLFCTRQLFSYNSFANDNDFSSTIFFMTTYLVNIVR